MSDWDDDEDTSAAPAPTQPAIVAKAKSKFADEDASDEDVKDDWDASDDEEEEAKKKAAAAKPTGPAPPVRAKGITKMKIAEKEAAEKARMEEMLARKNDDPNARKAREKAAQLKADLDNAAALFGGVAVGDTDILSARRTTKDDFDSLSADLAELLISKHSTSPQYALFVESFVRNLAAPLNNMEVKKAASALTTLANEKQKAEKDAAGGKKKKAQKPGLGIGKTASRAADTAAYDEVLDDSGEYDDFM